MYGRRNFRGNRYSNNIRSGSFNKPKTAINHLVCDVTFVAMRGNNAVSLDQYEKSHIIILYYGASNHLVTEEIETCMLDIEPMPNNVSIHIAYGAVMKTNKIGKVRVKYQDMIICIEALIFPGLKYNSLAWNELVEKGIRKVINKTNMTTKVLTLPLYALLKIACT